MSDSTLRLVRAQQFELDPGPLPTPFCDATMGPFTHWKVNWLQLTADDGVVGQAPGGLHPLACPLLLDGQARDLDQWWHDLWWALRNSGHRNGATAGTLFAIDMALRDIRAQRAGQPWHRFNGAQRDVVPVYGSGGGTNLDRDQLTAQMRQFVEAGFTTVKMKVATDFGRRPDEDVQRVKAVREAIGPDVQLAVDANQAWSAVDALRFADRIAGCDIAWFEEPVHSADRHAIAAVARQCPFPVAMGESENHWLGFRDLVECGVQHLQPPPHGLPGLARWSEAVAFAEQADRTWSSGGTSPFTAMDVATRSGGMVEYLAPIIGHLCTCFADCPRIEQGMIRLPADRPGLPVRVDLEDLHEKGAMRVRADHTAP
ncbi:MAG: mandelate racemase/muconate lactonizing enzyme family protein [Phycisphaeraceae bacterium]